MKDLKSSSITERLEYLALILLVLVFLSLFFSDYLRHTFGSDGGIIIITIIIGLFDANIIYLVVNNWIRVKKNLP